MADKNFSVDDIINEYSKKTSGSHKPDGSLDLDGLIDSLGAHDKEAVKPKKIGPKTEVIEDVLEIGSNEGVFIPDENGGEPHYEQQTRYVDGVPGVRPASEDSIEFDKIILTAEEDGEPEIDAGLRHARRTEQGTDVLEKMFEEDNPAPAHEAEAAREASFEPAKEEMSAKEVLERLAEEAARREKEREAPEEAESVRRQSSDTAEIEPPVPEEPVSEKTAELENIAEKVDDATRAYIGTDTVDIPQAEPKIRPVEESIHRTAPLRPVRENGSNTAIMEGLLKLKKERGAPKHRDSKVPPVNRASFEDIGSELDSKIIPNTEIGLDENATEEERLAYLNAKRRERVKQFVIDADEDEEPKKSRVLDFTSFEQAKEMAGSIASLKASLVVRCCVLLVASLVSAYISFANDLNLPVIALLSRSENQGMPYLFVNVVLGLAACFVSYTVMAVGLKKLFTLKADSDSLAAVSSILSIASGIALLTDTELVQLSVANVYISAAVIGLLINTVGKLFIVTRTERNFRYVSGGYSKYGVMRIDDEDVASKFTKGALTDFPSLATSRKTEFVSDFIKNSYSSDMTDAFCKYYVPAITAVSLIVGVISAFLHPAEINTGTRMLLFGLSCAAGTSAICSAAGMMLVVNIPLAKASKKYLQGSAVMLGYSAVDEFSDTNSLLVDAVDLFPDGMVEIINIKPAKKTPIEDGIIYAASLCCQTESILKPTFYKMIKGKTEMLFPVESYLYEDGLGLLGWIQNKRVLFGNRALMESHSIEGLPTPEKEAQYQKEDSSLLYLSIGGSLAMIFVVKLKASVSVAKALRDLERQNITVIIRSVDSLLSISRIAELFGVMPNMFKLLPFRFHNEYDEQTSYVGKMSSPMIYSGHFASLAMLITGTKRLQRASAVGIAIQLISGILGVILSVIFAFIGIFTSLLNPSTVIAYILLFVVITAIVQSIAKT